MSLTDKLLELIPSGWASSALGLSLGMAGIVFGVGESQQLAPYLPSWLAPLSVRIVACLCIVVAGSWAALFFMVRSYRDLERTQVEEVKLIQTTHAEELARRAIPAAAQGASTVTRISRRDLLRNLDIDPMP